MNFNLSFFFFDYIKKVSKNNLKILFAHDGSFFYRKEDLKKS